MKAKKTEAEWDAIFADHERSGMMAGRYCDEHGISRDAFYSQAHARRHRKGKKQKPKVSGEFLKLASAPGAHELNGSIRVTLKSGAYIDVSAHNAEGLKTVLAVLGEVVA